MSSLLHRLPETPIVVDYFTPHVVDEYKSSSPIALTCPLLFFLSHVHADHTVGLTPSWNAGKLYTTKINAQLVTAKFNIERSLIHVLSFYEPTSITLTYPNARCSLPPTTISVTAIPAHHCPGAAIFLFKGYFGHIVYTGDCRWHAQADITRSLTIIDEHRPIDALHIDNTFANTIFNEFHTRVQCVTAIQSIIRVHDDCDVIINSDLIGKEDVLVLLSHRMQTLICVDNDKYRLLTALHDTHYSLCEESNEQMSDDEGSCLQWPNWYRCFTTDPAQTYIRCLPKRFVTKQSIVNMNKSLRAGERRVIGILMTGWALQLTQETKQAEHVTKMTAALIQRPHLARSLSHITVDTVLNKRPSEVDNTVVDEDDPILDDDADMSQTNSTNTVDSASYCCSAPSLCTMHFIPYSSHSSHNELCQLVKLIRPRTVYAITRNPLPMNIFRQWMDETAVTPINMPIQLTSPIISSDRAEPHQISMRSMSGRRRDQTFVTLKRKRASLIIDNNDDAKQDDDSEVEICDERSHIPHLASVHAPNIPNASTEHTVIDLSNGQTDETDDKPLLHVHTAAPPQRATSWRNVVRTVTYTRPPLTHCVATWGGSFMSPPSTAHSYRCQHTNCSRALHQHKLTMSSFMPWHAPTHVAPSVPPPLSIVYTHVLTPSTSSIAAPRRYPPLPLMNAQSSVILHQTDITNSQYAQTSIS